MLRIHVGVSTRIVRIASLALGILGSAAFSYAVTPLPFTPNNPIGGQPVGFSFAGNKFVGTILGDGTGRLYSTDLTGNSIAPFGGTVSLVAGHGQEHYVSSSIGLGGFPNGDIYVASGNNIQHITNAGVADPGLFVTGSAGLNGLVRGITFDAFGTFGNQMIVTTDTGFVYTINSAGTATNIASTGEDTEGLDVAPVGPGAHWGGLNGALFVASENSGTIRAIKPVSFAVTTVGTIPSAEQLDFVPLNLGASGSPLEGMYSANYPNNVLKAPYTDFTTMIDDVIITGETTKQISDLSAVNTFTGVGVFPNQPEDGLFVTAAMVPEPGTLTLLGAGGLLLLSRRRNR